MLFAESSTVFNIVTKETQLLIREQIHDADDATIDDNPPAVLQYSSTIRFLPRWTITDRAFV